MEGFSSLWSGLSNIGSSISDGVSGLWNNISSIGTTAPDIASTATKASPSLWSALGSDAFKNVAGMGVAGYNALQNSDALSQQKSIQNAQLAMAKDAYNRNKLADEARQKLSF